MSVLTQGLMLASMLVHKQTSKAPKLLQHNDLTSPWRHPSTFGQSQELWERGEPFSDVKQPRYLREGSRGVDSALGTKPERQRRSDISEAWGCRRVTTRDRRSETRITCNDQYSRLGGAVDFINR